jgi:hypothetical protein
MKRNFFLASVLIFVGIYSAYSQIQFDSNGNIIPGTGGYDYSQDLQDFTTRLWQSVDNNAAQQRELQRIEAEQAIERQRLQNDQYIQQEQLRIQREQAEAANQRNYQVSVYGTTLWRDNEPSGLKDREEVFTIVAASPEKAEARGIELFKAKWKSYLIDDPNIWAVAALK